MLFSLVVSSDFFRNTADPEFMEIAIDYAEAMRNARDLVKLAKLTKTKVSGGIPPEHVA